MTHTLPNADEWRARTQKLFSQPTAWIIYFGFCYSIPHNDPDLSHWDKFDLPRNTKLPCNCSFLGIF